MDTPLKFLEPGEMISVTDKWINGAEFASVPEVKPLLGKVKAVHDALVHARPAEAPSTPAEITAMSVALRALDIRHDHALRAVFYLELAAEEHALAGDPPDEEHAAEIAALRGITFPNELGGTAATYEAEEGNAKKAQAIVDADPAHKKLLGGLHISKKESGLDLLGQYVALGAELGDKERQKNDAIAKSGAEKPATGTFASARNGWIRVVGTVLRVLADADGEVAAKLRREVIELAAKASKKDAAAAAADKAKKGAAPPATPAAPPKPAVT